MNMALWGLGDGSVLVNEDLNSVSRACIEPGVTRMPFSLSHKKILGEGHTEHKMSFSLSHKKILGE